MRRSHRRHSWTAAAVTVMSMSMAPVLVAAPGTSAATGRTADAVGPQAPVVVVLANQHRDLPDSGGARTGRLAAIRDEQAPLLGQVSRSGGRDVRSFSVINGFAATVSPAEAGRLAATPGVAAVVPDVPVRLAAAPGAAAGTAHVPGAASGSIASTGRAHPTLAAAAAAGICPASASTPLLEPEALQLTHAADPDPAVPQAQSLVDGHGVKVAFLADGLDIHNQDFVRADGTPVFSDYQDFTGFGAGAPTGGAEAFGDASAIAAQGLHSYDLSQFVNQAHRLPAGCDIRIRGMAPGASLVGLDVFGGGTAPSSVLLQAIDYAVNVDQVDVIDESFGSNPAPDLGLDPVALADDAAVAAGVTVVASTGDSGSGGTVGTPASDPAVIGVGATTALRAYAQTGERAFGLSGGVWADSNISTISSGGVTEAGRSVDLVAPGDLGWALCSADLAAYSSCAAQAAPVGQVASPIQEFGGTSQAAPLTAGAAALVIEAYERTHGGSRPTPALVKQILTSTATDLGLPGAEQGAGLVDSLAAVRMAESVHDAYGTPASQGDGLQVSGQLSDIAAPGHVGDLPLTVTNTSPGTQVVRASGRVLGAPYGVTTGTVTLDATAPDAPTFVDQLGRRRAYVERTFAVPAGADRLDASLAFAFPGGAVFATLIDPHGVYTENSLPQGASDYAHLEVRSPAAGTWTAVFYGLAGPAGFDGPVHYRFQAENNVPYGTVTPVELTLAPGASGTFDVRAPTPQTAGDLSGAVELDSTTSAGSGVGGQGTVGLRVAVPLTLRALILPSAEGGAFTGILTGGNGRGTPATTSFWNVDVPAGRHDLSVGITEAGTQDLCGLLIAPDGQTYASASTLLTDEAGTATHSGTLQMDRRDPQPGRWTIVLFTDVLDTGTAVTQDLTGRVSLDAVQASATGLPTGGITLAAAKPVTAMVTVTNTGVARQEYFVDPRLTRTGTVPLTASSGTVAHLGLPLASAAAVPIWQVPTESTALTVSASGSRPIDLDLEAGAGLTQGGQPEVYAHPLGDGATATVTAAEVTAGQWSGTPGLIGPTPSAVRAAVDLKAQVVTQLFDPAVTTSTGDFWATAVVPGAAPASGLVLDPGQSGAMVVTFTPSAPVGTVVSGTLYVDAFSRTLDQGDELAAIPYSYTAGR